MSFATHCQEVNTMSWFNDTEELRWICRIMAITFRIAKSLPAGTISRGYILAQISLILTRIVSDRTCIVSDRTSYSQWSYLV